MKHAAFSHAVTELFKKAREQRLLPGGLLAVEQWATPSWSQCFGRWDYQDQSPKHQWQHQYDLASITKVFATTAAIAQLVFEQRLSFSDSVESHLPAFASSGLKGLQVRHLLSHCSGLPSTWPLRFEPRSWTSREQFFEQLFSRPAFQWTRWCAEQQTIVEQPRERYELGQQTIYSDIGMMALGALVEAVSGQRLDVFCQQRIYQPMACHNTEFRPLPENCHLSPKTNTSYPLSGVVPSERQSLTEGLQRGLIQGQVHDSKAFLADGVAGHAGLFSTASDLLKFMRVVLTEDTKTWPAARIMRSMAKRAEIERTSHFGLGWRTNWRGKETPGPLFSDASFGHDGFTGTSLWADPKSGLSVVLLTNRCHPEMPDRLASTRGLRVFRQQIFELVHKTFAPSERPKRRKILA